MFAISGSHTALNHLSLITFDISRFAIILRGHTAVDPPHSLSTVTWPVFQRMLVTHAPRISILPYLAGVAWCCTNAKPDKAYPLNTSQQANFWMATIPWRSFLTNRAFQVIFFEHESTSQLLDSYHTLAKLSHKQSLPLCAENSDFPCARARMVRTAREQQFPLVDGYHTLAKLAHKQGFVEYRACKKLKSPADLLHTTLTTPTGYVCRFVTLCM